MNSETISPDQEYAFYAEPENQVPQGPPRRRHEAGKTRLSEPVPVRFPSDVLTEVKRAAQADDRSVSAWIRRAVEHELQR